MRKEAAQILAQMCTDDRIRLLVAIETEMLESEMQQLLGAVTLVIIPNLTYAGRPWAMIENVVVAQSARRQGIGRQLVQEAIRLAHVGGCYKVQLISGTKPEQLAFYKQLGFQSEQSIGHKRYL